MSRSLRRFPSATASGGVACLGRSDGALLRPDGCESPTPFQPELRDPEMQLESHLRERTLLLPQGGKQLGVKPRRRTATHLGVVDPAVQEAAVMRHRSLFVLGPLKEGDEGVVCERFKLGRNVVSVETHTPNWS